jgi:magnesium chelatase family protein
MVAKVFSAVPRGVEALRVQVEVDAHPGSPMLSVVGLPDPAVREARERVLAAIRHLGCHLDTNSIVVNLSPAEERKEGALLDLAIATGVLMAAGHVPGDTRGAWLLGELSLDGTLRPVRGVLPIVEAATAAGAAVVLPIDNVGEAEVVRGAHIFRASSLSEVVRHLRGEQLLPEAIGGNGHREGPPPPAVADLSEVAGQEHAKRALEIAAAGGHHLLFLGPPGAGKTMLAQRLPGILPPLDEGEALATTKVYSVAPGVSRPRGLIRERPFRAPHHTISAAGLVGGGTVPRPGEVSLAHNGVLFLDEITEFRRRVRSPSPPAFSSPPPPTRVRAATSATRAENARARRRTCAGTGPASRARCSTASTSSSRSRRSPTGTSPALRPVSVPSRFASG